MDQQFSRYVNVSALKTLFNVSNSYVIVCTGNGPAQAQAHPEQAKLTSIQEQAYCSFGSLEAPAVGKENECCVRELREHPIRTATRVRLVPGPCLLGLELPSDMNTET
jgi:hypothetical protein